MSVRDGRGRRANLRTLDQDLIWFWLQSLRSNSVSQRWYPSQTDTQAMPGEVQMSVRDGRTDNPSLPWNSSCGNMHTWSGLCVSVLDGRARLHWLGPTCGRSLDRCASVRDGRTDNPSLPCDNPCGDMHTWCGLSAYPSWTDVRDCMGSDRHARGVWIGVRPSRTDMPTGELHVHVPAGTIFHGRLGLSVRPSRTDAHRSRHHGHVGLQGSAHRRQSLCVCPDLLFTQAGGVRVRPGRMLLAAAHNSVSTGQIPVTTH